MINLVILSQNRQVFAKVFLGQNISRTMYGIGPMWANLPLTRFRVLRFLPASKMQNIKNGNGGEPLWLSGKVVKRR
jgi:hypothetical protein